jgi:hypothetical protein
MSCFIQALTKMLIMHRIIPLFAPQLDKKVLILSANLNLNIL